MQQHKQPTKHQIRDWLNDLVASHKPPPEPDVIREQLWHMERDRRQVLS